MIPHYGMTTSKALRAVLSLSLFSHFFHFQHINKQELFESFLQLSITRKTYIKASSIYEVHCAEQHHPLPPYRERQTFFLPAQNIQYRFLCHFCCVNNCQCKHENSSGVGAAFNKSSIEIGLREATHFPSPTQPLCCQP